MQTVGPYSGKETGETSLLRRLLKGFSAGDIVIADRFSATLVDRDVHEIERSCFFARRSDTPIFEPESDWVNKIT